MAQQHEADLANLATDPPSTTVSEATTTTTTESTTSPTPTTVRTNKGKNFRGDRCLISVSGTQARDPPFHLYSLLGWTI